ncbi:MAG: FHA domain-containing protein [Deltaproteobacteria bacterium]|nr:FHA domain-containing protein [Deltaproteobacteria bacterium]
MSDRATSPRAQLMLRGTRSVKLSAIGRRPLLIGRHEAADIVVREPSISRHHALVWRSGRGIAVRDIGSALGTRVGSRLLGPGDSIVVGEGEDIVLAHSVRLFWVRGGGVAPAATPCAVVETEPGRYDGPLAKTHPHMSLSPEAEELLSGLTGSDSFSPNVTVTVQCDDTGPKAVRIEANDGNGLRVRGESRIVLLYMLAGQTVRFQRGELPSAWMDDGDLAQGLWGRAAKGGRRQASRINTVLSRIRVQLREAGLGESLLEKASGRTRLRPDAAQIMIEQGPTGAESAVG